MKGIIVAFLSGSSWCHYSVMYILKGVTRAIELAEGMEYLLHGVDATGGSYLVSALSTNHIKGVISWMPNT